MAADKGNPGSSPRVFRSVGGGMMKQIVPNTGRMVSARAHTLRQRQARSGPGAALSGQRKARPSLRGAPRVAAPAVARVKVAPRNIKKGPPSFDLLGAIGRTVGDAGAAIGNAFSRNPVDQLYRSVGERIQGATRRR